MRLYLALLVCLPFRLLAQSDSASFDDWLKQKRADVHKGGRHFLSAGAGMLTTDFLLDGYHAGKPVTRDYENLSPRLVYFLNYKYRISPRTFIGMTVTYEEQYGDWLDNNVYGGAYNLYTTNKGQFVRNSFTTAVEMSTDYTERGMARFYFACGAGITYSFATDQYLPDYYNQNYQNGVNYLGPIRQSFTRNHFNGFISPLGFKVGRKLCYFVEAGFGYKGAICSGLTYRFDKKDNK
jgi:hypothetical protein